MTYIARRRWLLRLLGDIVSDVAEFGSQHGVNQQALRSIVQAYLFFFRNAIRQNLSVAHVKEDLVKIGVCDFLSSFETKTAALYY